MAVREPKGRGGPEVPRLVLLTDRAQLRLGRGLVSTLAECVEAGLGQVVVRELDLPEERRAALVAALVRIDGLVVVSAHTRLPGAHGVHLPAAPGGAGSVLPAGPDGAAAAGRTPHRWWGQSCHDGDEVRRAAAAGADYATLSPFAASVSKPGHGPPVDRALFAAGHGLPVLALGGIGPGSAAEARAAGAHGVAVMGAVMRASEPATVVEALLREVAT